jgi:hypothetical protein
MTLTTAQTRARFAELHQAPSCDASLIIEPHGL